jgi:hypothetical protein
MDFLQFQEAMDPSYFIVDFRGNPPTEYRLWLDEVNHFIGGSAPNPSSHNVGINSDERITFMDPALTDISFLQVDSKANADHVAVILRGHGLHTWLMESKTPVLWR